MILKIEDDFDHVYHINLRFFAGLMTTENKHHDESFTRHYLHVGMVGDPDGVMFTFKSLEAREKLQEKILTKAGHANRLLTEGMRA